MISAIKGNLTSSLTKVINMTKKPDRTQELRIAELKSNIELSRELLRDAMDNFNNVTEPKLIDFYTYKIMSEQKRYEQLLGEYKVLLASSGLET